MSDMDLYSLPNKFFINMIFFIKMLFISDNKCGNLTVGDVLKWAVGCSKLPPGGLEKKINVHFTQYEQYPTVSTCSLDMTFPLNLTSYSLFKKVMIEAIVSGQGFGSV